MTEHRQMPIDRGWAWMTMLGAAVCMFIVVGMFRTMGVLFVEFIEAFGASYALSSWMVGVTACGMSLFSPLANQLSVTYSSRSMVMTGSLLCAIAAFATSWAPNIYFVICVFGGLTGVGYAFMFGPSLTLIGHYFDKRRSLANGIALAGASMGCLVMPPLMAVLIDLYTIWGALMVYSAFVLNGFIAAMLLRPVSFYKSSLGLKKVESLSRIQKAKSFSMNDIKARVESDSNLGGSDSMLHHQRESVSKREPTPNKEQRTSGLNGCKLNGLHHLDPEHPVETLKSRTLLVRLGDHYTSKESLFVADGQSIPDDLVKQELQLKQSQLKRHTSDGTLVQPKAINAENRQSYSPMKCCKQLQLDIFRNPLFIIFAVTCSIGNSCYLDHYVILPPHAEDLGISKSQAALILSLTGAADLITRVIFGWFGDLNMIKRSTLLSITMVITGVSTTICSFFPTYASLFVTMMVLGFVSAIHIIMMTVVLMDFVGLVQFANAFGMFIMIQGLFNTGFPAFLGWIKDVTGSYSYSFLTLGLLMILGGALIRLEPCARKWEDSKAA